MPALASVLADNLIVEGFDVQTVDDGDLAVAKAREFAPDLIVLDVMLPGKDGFELCGLLRHGRRTPIVMLTARSQKADRIRGSQARRRRLRHQAVRSRGAAGTHPRGAAANRPDVERLTLGRMTIDFRTLHAWSGRGLELTHREFELLRYLAERQEVVVDRDELLREVWGYASAPHTRSVDQAIVRLRKKIEPDPQHPVFIHTVHGNGYCLT